MATPLAAAGGRVMRPNFKEYGMPRNKTNRLKAMLKAKKTKERARKSGRLTKRRNGGRLVKVSKRS